MLVKKVDVRNKYRHEIQDISNKLNQLEQGRIYDNTRARMDGSLATNIEQLRRMLSELIYKIEYDKDSVDDEIAEVFGKVKV
ncbi:hypothetical protein [Natronincola ferrireducens]|uniref:Uncharacterized protein n=1 Tax=Natronincola ferrireducens TaxID=393762 RepID=A0A1G9IFL0_9FIRM|nr:hypothetical protein [Natronincola ferrireducens]SDL23805.1 hypothetical protein SAMN05660472_02852 [Natronincola ferrireducens]